VARQAVCRHRSRAEKLFPLGLRLATPGSSDLVAVGHITHPHARCLQPNRLRLDARRIGLTSCHHYIPESSPVCCSRACPVNVSVAQKHKLCFSSRPRGHAALYIIPSLSPVRAAQRSQTLFHAASSPRSEKFLTSDSRERQQDCHGGVKCSLKFHIDC
jgi:hypothetical protein